MRRVDQILKVLATTRLNRCQLNPQTRLYRYNDAQHVKNLPIPDMSIDHDDTRIVGSNGYDQCGLV